MIKLVCKGRIGHKSEKFQLDDLARDLAMVQSLCNFDGLVNPWRNNIRSKPFFFIETDQDKVGGEREVVQIFS